MEAKFLNDIKSRAAENIQNIVLPETGDKRTYLAASELLRDGVARITLIGNPDDIDAHCSRLRIRLDGVDIIDPATADCRPQLAELVYQKRKHKGLSLEDANGLLDDYIHFAAALVASDKADGYVAGAAHPTAAVMRPALTIIGPAPGVKTVSSYLVIISPLKEFGDNGVLFFADGGVVPEPTAEQMAQIAVTTARTVKSVYKIEPRVAMMSFSTRGSASHPLVDKVKTATELARQEAPDILIDGELQADAALVPEVAARKAPDSPVAGKANILVFPDINSGNLCYKIAERLGSARAFGPLMQGLNKPANDLSRGCSASDIVGVVAVTAVVAGAQAANP